MDKRFLEGSIIETLIQKTKAGKIDWSRSLVNNDYYVYNASIEGIDYEFSGLKNILNISSLNFEGSIQSISVSELLPVVNSTIEFDMNLKENSELATILESLKSL